MNRFAYFINALLCLVNFALWFGYAESKTVAFIALAVGVWSGWMAYRTADPYYYRG